MIRNYFKTAWRNLWKYKAFSLINIFGLAVAMSVCMLIILMLSDQISFDKFHEKKERIYRIATTPLHENKLRATIPFPVADELKRNSPAIEETVSLRRGFGGDAIYNEQLAEIKGYFSTPSFFKVFSYPLEKGDLNTALQKPNSVVISHKAALKLFGKENAIGKTITLVNRGLAELSKESTEEDKFGLFTVTGVFAENNQKSHIEFDAILSSATLTGLQTEGKMEDLTGNWSNDGSTHAYALLRPSANEEDLTRVLNKITEEHLKNSKDENLKNSHLTFQKLTRINPGPVVINAPSETESLPLFVYYIIGGLAMLIMLTSCLNYTSLTTARSITRAGEIGLRKVIGAHKKDILLQFLCETLLTVFLSSVMALACLILLKNAFLQLWINRSLKFELTTNLYVFLAFVGFTFVVGIISGIYPAMKFSKTKPIVVLKKMVHPYVGKWSFRKILTVSQFSISIIFIITSLVIYNQFKHYLTFDYGFNANKVVNIDLQGHDFELVKNSLIDLPGVTFVGGCAYLPATGRQDGLQLTVPGTETSFKAIDMTVDADFVKALQIPVLYGENLPDKTNNNAVLVNETAVKEFGFNHPTDILGETYLLNNQEVRVTGVIQDITFFLLFSPRPTGPIVLHENKNNINYATIKYSGNDPALLLKAITNKWKSIDAVHPLQYEFYDETLANTNKGILDLVSVIGFLAFIAVTVACLGLLGMIIYTTERRTKEIGIRKTLGASEWTLNYLLSREYLILLGLAIIIASPLAILLNNYWLNFMVVRDELSADTIVLGCIIVIFLGLMAVVPQTLKIARSNPVKSLRTE